MRRASDRALAGALALVGAAPLAAQSREPIVFAGEAFDVTGAGERDLGEIDPVLAPYRKTFRARPFLAGFALDLMVDAQGNVVGCEAKPGEGLAKAGATICADARAAGRFRPDPCLALDYARAPITAPASAFPWRRLRVNHGPPI